MRKSVILLIAIMLIIAATILILSIKNRRAQIEPRAVPNPTTASLFTHTQAVTTLARSPAATAYSMSDNTSLLLQVSMTDTTILKRKLNNWMTVRGCDPIKGAQDIDASIDTLQQQALNNDLTAAAVLGFHLIYDPSNDGRDAAKQVLWQAALQGSTCALFNYYFFWQRNRDAQRSIMQGRDGKSHVHYIPHIPATAEDKRQAIINAYAWDLVWEMRTGTVGLPEYSANLERQYGGGFQWTPMAYAEACEKAVDLYYQLQSAREAVGYGPFDNSPPPVITGTNPEVGSHCDNWPVTRPQCQKAELHEIDRSGVIHAFEAWVCTANQASSLGESQ